MPDIPAPENQCDLVMKGGITSGVVYPMAVVELAKHYRFVNIGGTSAGAIAAVLTAAAEFGRSTGGFDKIAALPAELSKTLLDKFQPSPQTRPLFDLLMAGLSGGKVALLKALLAAYPRRAVLGAAPGLLVIVGALVQHHVSISALLLGALLGILGTFAAAILGLITQARRDLPALDYGICSGLTPAGANGPALTDWLADMLDKTAGFATDQGPLTIRHLNSARIYAKTVTTDITTHRPYALPMQNNLHAFSVAEFRRLFPARIVDHMVAHSKPATDGWQGGPTDLYHFRSDDLPVVVLARMSLSFPFLIAAVPLWRRDFTLTNAQGATILRRCLFSDGGISSNFPVHFFDQFLPQTPTFGIALTSFDPARTPQGSTHEPRVSLPSAMRQGRNLPTKPFSGLLGFVWALFDSAKDWQDAMQSILPGYRERIVTVALKDDSEGGLNLAMPEPVITQLSGYGSEAGRLILSDFSLNEHRWRRYLVELEAISQLLSRFAFAWDGLPQSAEVMRYPDLAQTYAPGSFANLSAAQRALLAARAESIAALGRQLSADPLPDSLTTILPKSQSRLRVVPNIED